MKLYEDPFNDILIQFDEYLEFMNNDWFKNYTEPSPSSPITESIQSQPLNQSISTKPN